MKHTHLYFTILLAITNSQCLFTMEEEANSSAEEDDGFVIIEADQGMLKPTAKIIVLADQDTEAGQSGDHSRSSSSASETSDQKLAIPGSSVPASRTERDNPFQDLPTPLPQPNSPEVLPATHTSIARYLWAKAWKKVTGSPQD